MGLLSIFKRGEASPSDASPTEASEAVRQARTRARRRLIGAVVLLTIGVIGFPLVFETRPRPIPIDIPIEIPRKDAVPALVMPAARPVAADTRTAAPAPPATVAHASAPQGDAIITESKTDAGRDIEPRSAGASAAMPYRGVASKPATKATGAVAQEAPRKGAAASAIAAPAPAADPTRKAAPVADESRKAPVADESRKAAPAVASTPATHVSGPKAAVDAKQPAASEGGRFVVQVGAFAEAQAARETRIKVERLGLKTYTQVAQTPSGNRIRVRVGPFGTRVEADAALAKARGAGLTAVVLTL